MGSKTKKAEVGVAKSGNKTVKNEANSVKAEAKKYENSVMDELGRISDRSISLGASLAMGALLFTPVLMAVMAMFKRSIDFTMYMFIPMVKHFAFPFACSIVMVIYILSFIRIQATRQSLKNILVENPVFILFFLAAAFILISQFYNGAQYALTGFCAASLGETFGMEICYFVFILFGATQIKIESHKRFLLRAQMIFSCILVIAAFVLWHSQVESSFFSDWTPRFSSVFSNINYYGYYLAVAVPIAGAAFIYESELVWKAVAGISFVANTIALSLDDTLGAWVGAFLAVLFIIIAHLIIEKKVNWQALALIPVFMICLYLPGHIEGSFEDSLSSLTSDVSNVMQGGDVAEYAGNGRWRTWKASLDIVGEHSFMGIGFEGVKYRQYVGAPYNIRPHNEFIQYAMFHGVPMALFYFLGCIGVFLRALWRRKEMNGATLVALAGAFGYLVSSFFGLTVFSTGYFLFVFLGMGYVNGSTKSVSEGEAAKNHRSNIFITAVAILIVAGLVAIAGLAGVLSEDKTEGNTNSQNSTADNASDGKVLLAYENYVFYINQNYAVVTKNESSDDYGEVLEFPDRIDYNGTIYPVMVIDNSAFEGVESIKKVNVPSTVRIIGANAFDGCENLTEVSLPEGLEQIGDEAFNGCTLLKSIEIPSTVTAIGRDAFYSCESLKTAVLPQNLTIIPPGMFIGCSALSSVTIPSGVKTIGAEAFWECEKLTELEFLEGLQVIETRAFYGCAGLKKITLPASVESMGESVFDFCDSLKEVYVPAGALDKYKEWFADSDFEVKSYQK